MSRRPFYVVKPIDWPARDRMLWQAARTPSGLFDDCGFASGWRTATIRGCERGYGTWLGWLADNGWLDPDELPTTCVSRTRIAAFIEAYDSGRAPLTTASTVRDIAMVLRAMVPPDGVTWLTRMGFRMVNNARPVRPKAPRMAPIPDILDAAERVMAEGLSLLEEGKRTGAVLFRDGLMLAFLAYRPLRVRNFSGLRIGESFHVDDTGMRISIAAGATKMGVPIDVFVPEYLLHPLTLWLTHLRPLFIRDGATDQGWLWIGRRGGRVTENQVAARIGKISRRMLHRDLSPHLVRDCAVTQVALDAPENIGIAKNLLGHATFDASQKFYNQATSFAAAASHEAVIKRLREGDSARHGETRDDRRSTDAPR